MKNFLLKNKEIIIEIVVFTIIIGVLFLILNFNDGTLGVLKSDFRGQHIRLIDYQRNSFWQTHDLFPQITFNFGASQSMVDLYYYGMYNPLIVLSFFFPFISTMYWMQLVTMIIMILSFVAMNILLRRFNIDRKYVLIISVLCAFTPGILFHLSYHVMFTYYYPIMILSFVGIDMLLKDNKKWLFIICVALIFYTNFFFALIIGFVQLVFFIACLNYQFDFNLKEKINKYKQLIFSYLIGILIGMFTFIPQALALFGGSRVDKTIPSLDIINLLNIEKLIFDPYSLALGILGLFVLILAFLNYKNKFSLLLSISCTLVLLLEHFNYLLNVFQYTHSKIYIYLVPLLLFLLAYLLNNKKIKYKNIALGISSVIVLIYLINMEHLEFLNVNVVAFICLIIAQIIMMVLLINYKDKYKYFVVISLIACIASILNYAPHYITKEQYRDEIVRSKKIRKGYIAKKEDDFYRDNYSSNFSNAINNFSPLIYTSIINNEYMDFYNYFIEIEKRKNNRHISTTTIANILFSNITSVNKYLLNENDKARPFIYGVEKNNLNSLSDLKKIEGLNRLIALNEGFFVDGNYNEYKENKTEVKQVTSSKENIIFKKTSTINLDIPKQYWKKGVFIIEINALNENLERAEVSIGEHISVIRGENKYNEPIVDKSVFHLNTDGSIKNISIKFQGSNNKYDKVNVKFIEYNDFRNNLLEYVEASDIKIDYNKSYNFSLNMASNGYLGTSIFYDDGFIIKDNGKEIKKEKVNNNFLGAKLEKGKHNIVIEFKIKGFNEGMVLTIIGLFALGLIMVNEIKFLNRPFFRFVIVGAFNTVNYFIGYTILLNFIPYLIAHVLAFIYSAFVSYFLTAVYTFKTKPTFKTFIAFPLTFIPNLLMSSVGTAFIVELGLISKSIASLVVMIMIIPITFIINKFIFKKDDK
ncbi:putative flippase GtrA/uncharacterized membrane protein YfhO [Bacilli bacterium PM5-3]|nr:putative flippase GtrA/uncharacterized membrane protein YfhO [Bacilli bacterium PM5-3]MDH6603942.1 putative flippase GtrA/uncharacterized membrane protein YfhO [Bacilli bacterium PM5-9]